MLYQCKEEAEAASVDLRDPRQGYVTRVRRERGYGVNPWGTHTRFLVSHRLLIDETYAGHFARGWASSAAARC